jgi:hypothetical protein
MTPATALVIVGVIASWLPNLFASDAPVVRVAVLDYFYHEEVVNDRDAFTAILQVQVDCIRASASKALRDIEHPIDVVELELPDDQALITPAHGPSPLLDMTQLLAQDHLASAFLAQRLALCSHADQIVALPHDVHPILMTYPRHLAAELGVDPTGIATWEQALAVGRDLRHRHPDARLLSFTTDGSNDELLTLLAQRDAHLVDPGGLPVLATAEVVATISWYIRAVRGPEAICAPLDSGGDGFTAAPLCRVASDRRLHEIAYHADRLRLSLGMSPMPAWTAGGRRTSSLSACSALAISSHCHDPASAWRVIKALMTDQTRILRHALRDYLLPAWMPAWTQPVVDHGEERFGGLAPLRVLAGLAVDIPLLDGRVERCGIAPALQRICVAVGDRFEREPHIDLDPILMEALLREQLMLRAEHADVPSSH